jgi:hypothetical protein
MKIPIKKENKSSHLPAGCSGRQGDKNEISQKLTAPGPKVRDIKTNKAKSVDYKEPINSQIIKIKEEKEEKKPKKPAKSIIMLALAGVALIIGAIFIYLSIFRLPKDTLSKFTPKETFFYFHLNLNKLSKNQNINSLLEKLNGQKDLENSLDDLLNKNFLAKYNLNFKNDIKPILGEEAALAIFTQENEKIYPYIIFKVKSEEQFLKITEKAKPKNIQELNVSGAKIQTFLFDSPAKNFSFALIKNTAVIAQSKEVIEKIVQTYETKDYSPMKTRGKNLAQLYLIGEIIPQNLLNFLPKSFQKNNLLLYYLLLKNQNGSFEINEAKEGLAVNYFGSTNFGSTNSKNSPSVAGLLPFLPNDTIFAFLDYNLKNEYLAMKEVFQKSEKEKKTGDKYLENFEKMLAQKYSLNLENDFLPFFEKETAAVLLPKTNSQQSFVFFANIKDINEAEKKLEKIFLNLFAFSNLKEEPMELVDGTRAVELVPDKKAFEIKKENKEEIKIFSLIKRSDSQVLVSYAIKNNVLIIAQNKESLAKIIDNKEKLAENSLFPKSYQKINGQKMDSLLYFNVPVYLGYLNKPPSSQAFWRPAKSFLFGTKTKGNQVYGKGFLTVE